MAVLHLQRYNCTSSRDGSPTPTAIQLYFIAWRQSYTYSHTTVLNRVTAVLHLHSTFTVSFSEFPYRKFVQNDIEQFWVACSCKWHYISTLTVTSHDSFKVRTVLVNSVKIVTEYTTGSLVTECKLLAIQTKMAEM